MTSGRGIIHAERPLAQDESELTMHGIQLWTSLARQQKTMAPRYQRLEADAIPRIDRDGVALRVVAGTLAGIIGPAQVLMPLVLAHASLAPGARFEAVVPDDFEMAAYVIAGQGRFAGNANATTGELVLFDPAPGLLRVANEGASSLEVMLLGGAPAEGPLVFHGPFVMNNVEQVRAAEIAYRTGRMGTLEE
jgi:redox-sensitive bicupin YhaK (pirin superfamily)